MKLDELKALRDKAAGQLASRTEDAEPDYKIVVSMGTSGILYGARDILRTLLDEVTERDLNVLVTQSGSFGLDEIEPMCAIYHADEKVVYGKLSVDMIGELLQTHCVDGEILTSHRVNVPGDVGNVPEES
jgi:hypothetical protein